MGVAKHGHGGFPAPTLCCVPSFGRLQAVARAGRGCFVLRGPSFPRWRVSSLRSIYASLRPLQMHR